MLGLRDERGQAMVEFALVLVPLLLLVFGILEFGIAFNKYLTLTDAVRAGARAAAVSPSASACGKATTVVTTALPGATVDCPASIPAGTSFTVTGSYSLTINVAGFVVRPVTLRSSSTERKEG